MSSKMNLIFYFVEKIMQPVGHKIMTVLIWRAKASSQTNLVYCNILWEVGHKLDTQ